MLRVPFRFLEGCLIAAHAIESTARLHLHPRRVRARSSRSSPPRSSRCATRSCSATSRSSSTAAPAPTSAARRRRCSSRSRASAASRARSRRSRPIAGLYASPTAVNNVESITTATSVLELGGAEYAKIGVRELDGHARLLALGQRRQRRQLRAAARVPAAGADLRRSAAASPGGRELKAVIPGGSSTVILTADEVEHVTLDFDSLVGAGHGDRLGRA